MPHKVYIFAGKDSAYGSLLPILKESFNAPHFKVETISPRELHHGILRDSEARLLFVPGISKLRSEYPTEIGQRGAHEIKHFASHNNNVAVLLCAGMNPFLEHTEYTLPSGEKLEREGLVQILKADAHGPLTQYFSERAKPTYSDVTVVPVKYKDEQGKWRKAGISYGNGTPLYLHNEQDKNIDIIARFAKVANEPVAMARVDMGQGAVYFSCIHPEIHPAPVSDDISSDTKFEKILRLIKDLTHHEEGRKQFWNMFTNRIKQDLKL